MSRPQDSRLDAKARFATTRWSLVLGAQAAAQGQPSGPSEAVDKALGTLCESYWPAVYAYLRRHGHRHEVAQDLTQGFFAKVLEKGWIERADSAKGSFRAFLITILRRFVAGEFERENSQRRGGEARHLSISDVDAWIEPATNATPDQAFDQAWVRALLARVLENLRREYAAIGQADRFGAIEPFLVAGEASAPFQELSGSLGLAESSCRVAVFRARRRYRDLLRSEIAATVGDGADVDTELEALISSATGA